MTAADRKFWFQARLALMVLLIFSAGALAGALGMRYHLQNRVIQPQAFYTIKGEEVALDRLTKELDLTPEQAAQLEMVLDDFIMYVQMLQFQMDEVRASGKARILNILNDNQRVKFEKIMGNIQAANWP
ncbi:MAG TPA: hypothetical protein P5282_10495 [Anaerolineaceae bacterium]|nr:hypothetical protein [Anaerolineaceae bacterium]